MSVSTAARVIFGSLAVGAVGTGAMAAYDEGTRRSLMFWVSLQLLHGRCCSPLPAPVTVKCVVTVPGTVGVAVASVCGSAHLRPLPACAGASPSLCLEYFAACSMRHGDALCSPFFFCLPFQWRVKNLPDEEQAAQYEALHQRCACAVGLRCCHPAAVSPHCAVQTRRWWKH